MPAAAKATYVFSLPLAYVAEARQRAQDLAEEGHNANIVTRAVVSVGGSKHLSRSGTSGRERVVVGLSAPDVLDRVDQFPEFDLRRHYALTVSDAELTDVEREARAATSPDDIRLEL